MKYCADTRKAFEAMQTEGVKNVHFLDITVNGTGESLLPSLPPPPPPPPPPPSRPLPPFSLCLRSQWLAQLRGKYRQAQSAAMITQVRLPTR